ncbi:exported hypothetical protein [Thiocapsa sp. KS1]|nr:hypothetical protein [Thiocapsa sp. KS1]CRI67726.1 exported hypothetical protein [Thiocapsa sp. KS1]
MVTIKPSAVTFILIWSLIPRLAVSESTGPVALDAETRDPPRRSDEAGLGLREAEPANGDGQSPESVDPPGSDQDRDEAPSLGLCDGS